MKNQFTMADEVISWIRVRKGTNNRWNDWIERERRRGEWNDALYLCGMSLDHCASATTDANFCRGIALVYRGAVQQSMGDLDEAKQSYQAAFDVFSLIDDIDSKWSLCVADYALGMISQSADRWGEAVNHYLRSEDGLRQLIAHVLKDSEMVRPTHELMRRIHERIAQVRYFHERKKRENGGEQIPIIGVTSAGELIQAIEIPPEDLIDNSLVLSGWNCEVTRVFSKDGRTTLMLTPSVHYFALRVDGDSMVETGITDGCYVIFQHQRDVDNEEIAVVRVDYPDGAASMVKRFRRESNKIFLKAENKAFQPQVQVFCETDPTVHVLGRAIAVVEVRD